MKADIVREKEINTLRQCVFPFRSKKVCTLFLPIGVHIRSSVVWSEQDFGPDGPGSIPRWGVLWGFFFFGKLFFMFFSIMVKFIDTPPLRHVYNTDVWML